MQYKNNNSYSCKEGLTSVAFHIFCAVHMISSDVTLLL